MMGRLAWAVACPVVIAACAVGEPGPGIDVDRALGHAGALVALGPHPGQSPAARRALAYIESSLAAAGIAAERMPVGAVELPPIVVLGRVHRPARQVTLDDPNLVVRLGPRTGQAVLVMAHYDTVATSAGALDNSAAVAVLIELARALAATPPPQPIVLAFTANEEAGLVGAEALAPQLADRVAFALALDVIGGPGALSINGASTLIGGRELRWLAGAADLAGVVVRAPLPHRVISRWWPQAERSDHGPFTRHGVRAVHLYNRGHDGEWIDLAYHSSRDVVARIDRDAVDALGRLLRALAITTPPVHDGDGVWLPGAVNTVIPRWPVVGLELGFAAIALVVLVRLRDPPTRGGLGILAAIGCYVGAAGAAFAVERVVAGGHPAPWLHAPVAWLIGIALVFGGALGLASRIAARFRPWTGSRRYLAIAIAVPLVCGLALVFAGAAEIAWIWLVPAAVIAVAPRLGRGRLVAVVTPLLPAVLVLAPNQLREAAWNGFLPASIAVTMWVAIFAIPVVAAQTWYIRSRPASGPLGTFVLSMGCGVAILVGLVVVVRAAPACSAAQFQAFHLACESRTGMH